AYVISAVVAATERLDTDSEFTSISTHVLPPSKERCKAPSALMLHCGEACWVLDASCAVAGTLAPTTPAIAVTGAACDSAWTVCEGEGASATCLALRLGASLRGTSRNMLLDSPIPTTLSCRDEVAG